MPDSLLPRIESARTREEDSAMTQERSEEFIARLDRYADALIAKIGETEGKNWFEFADQTDRAGLYSLAETAIEVADKEHEELVEALVQVRTVCADNDAPACDHRLALKFIDDVARAALEKAESDG